MTMAFDADNDVSDEALLGLYGNGDRRAARELTVRLTPLAFRVALRMLGDRAEAEDIAQEAMLRLWKVAPDWRRGEARVSTWLYRVVMNAAHDLRRRQMTRSRAADGWGDWEIARQDEASAEREARLWLEDAMARLGPDLRDTVALVLGEELTQAEAAKVLGVSEGTVAWRMSEVKKRLRRMAQEEAQ